MGEYEDRYPDAYGRDDPPPSQQPAREQTRDQAAPRDEVIRPTSRPPLRENDRPAAAPLSSVRSPSDWQHEPAGAAAAASPRAPTPRDAGPYRGLGPRGYNRAPQRIYEDICDRLTENPFIDASDVEVRVNGFNVTLSGSVDSAIASRQAEQIADEVVGVGRVHNRLIVRSTPRDAEPTPGDQVNRAMGSPGGGRVR